MTVTISRLYDNHNDAQQAVGRLEAAGVPHSDISIVANNSDSWFNTDKKVDRDHDEVDDRAEGARKGRHWRRRWWHRRFLPGSACSQSPDWDQLLQLAGSPRRRLARQQGQLLAVLSVRSPKRAFRKTIFTPTPRASNAEARWCQRAWPIRSVPVSTRCWISPPSTCGTEVLPGRKQDGNRSMLAANPTARGGPEGTRVVRRWPSLSKH